VKCWPRGSVTRCRASSGPSMRSKFVALSGYADAGHLAEQVRETLLGGLPSEVLARFDSE
jgi:hypothetical protein